MLHFGTVEEHPMTILNTKQKVITECVVEKSILQDILNNSSKVTDELTIKARKLKEAEAGYCLLGAEKTLNEAGKMRRKRGRFHEKDITNYKNDRANRMCIRA